MNFILLKFGCPPVVIKTEDKENYFAALQQADTGTLSPFVEYVTDNLNHSLEIMIRGASASRTKYLGLSNCSFPPSLRYRTGLDSYGYQTEPVP